VEVKAEGVRMRVDEGQVEVKERRLGGSTRSDSSI
jgi:hypothetical protein